MSLVLGSISPRCLRNRVKWSWKISWGSSGNTGEDLDSEKQAVEEVVDRGAADSALSTNLLRSRRVLVFGVSILQSLGR